MQRTKQNLIDCLAPNCCDNTTYATAQDEVKAGEPVEWVSTDATTGKVVVKKLTDATKLYGVAIEDAKANNSTVVINRGDLRADPIVMPAGLLKKDLVVDATNAPHLNLVKGV